ncbi:MAG: ribbon-helix-helix domain-containing protein [Thermoplasmata archaeon]
MNSKVSKDVHLKIPEAMVKKLDDFCAKRGENRSTLIRRLILKELARHQYLDDEMTKVVLGGVGDTE